MKRARVIAGWVGIAVGLVGLANIVAERREAGKRREMFSTLAENFRKHEQERRTPRVDGSVEWEGQVFRPNDRVRIRKWAGTFKTSDTGAGVEVHAGPGQVGVVVRGEKRVSTDHLRVDPAEPMQIVRVRWRPQQWKDILGRPVELPQFEATIHVSHLELAH